MWYNISMNTFIQQILIIVAIAMLGMVIATPAIVVEQASSYDVYFEYDRIIPVTENGCVIFANNLTDSFGEVSVTGSKVAYVDMFVDGQKVKTQEAIDGYVFFEYDFGFGQHGVKVIAYDQYGKELKYARFNLDHTKKEDF